MIIALLLGSGLVLVFLVRSRALPFQAQQSYAAVGDRGEFTPDACIEYDPTGSDRHTTVFVDPGHGGPDPGAGGQAPDGTLLQEKTLTLAVALDLLPLLRQAGYRVVLARTRDVPVARLTTASLAGGAYTLQGEHSDIRARIDCANAAGAQLLLSIHFNSYDDPSVGGAETIYDPIRPFSAQNTRFAGLVQQAVLAGLAAHGWQIPDRGITSDTLVGSPALSPRAATYGHLLELGPAASGWLDHPSRMPGVLSEPLFLTDPGEAAVAESQAGQRALARSFASAVNAYFASPAGGKAS